MKLKNLEVARWPFFTFQFLFNCLRYERNNDQYKQVQKKYKSPVLIFIFDKVKRQVHIGRTNSVDVWVFLFRRCTRMLYWRTGCTCESQSSRYDRRRSAL